MIPFTKLTPDARRPFLEALANTRLRLCVNGFATHFIWGEQQIAFAHGCVLFFSTYGNTHFYSYPLGPGDRRAAVEEILADAAQRGLSVRIGGMNEEAARELDTLFPGRFQISAPREQAEYIYDIHDLAQLKGRKFQKKRNHANRFRAEHPDYQVVPLDESNFAAAKEMLALWYRQRAQREPEDSLWMEQEALRRTLAHFDALAMEGAVLVLEGQIIAVTIASPLSQVCYDVHFEKALEAFDGAYAVINQDFSAMLAQRHPQLQFLNREEDMGLPGLRQAKLSYNPHHLEERYHAKEYNNDNLNPNT